MNIVPLYDVNLIRSIMMHEDILPTIHDDTWNGTVYQPDVENEIFLGCVVDGVLIGLYNLHWITGVTLQGHAHILKAHRKEHSVKSCKEVMRWVLKYVARCQKIDCFVPTLYSNVIKFLSTCGFTKEGISRNSFMLNGQLYDRVLLGLTRERMKDIVNE